MKLYKNFALCIMLCNSFLHSSMIPSTTQNSPQLKIRPHTRRKKNKNFITFIEEQVYTDNLEEEQHTHFCAELETQNIAKDNLQKLLSKTKSTQIAEWAQSRLQNEGRTYPEKLSKCKPCVSTIQLSDAITSPQNQQKEKELKNTELKKIATPQQPKLQEKAKKSKPTFVEKVIEHGQDSRIILDAIIDAFTNVKASKCTSREIVQFKKLLFDHYDVYPKTPTALNDKLRSLCYSNRTQSVAGVLMNTHAYYYNIHCNQTRIIPFNANNIKLQNNENTKSPQTTLDEDYIIEVLGSHDLQQPKYAAIITNNKKIYAFNKSDTTQEGHKKTSKIINECKKNKHYKEICDKTIIEESLNCISSMPTYNSKIIDSTDINKSVTSKLREYCLSKNISSSTGCLYNGFSFVYNIASDECIITLIDIQAHYDDSDTNNKSKSRTSISESNCTEQQIPELVEIAFNNKIIHENIKPKKGGNITNPFLEIIYDKVENKDYTIIEDAQVLQESQNELLKICDFKPEEMVKLLDFLQARKSNTVQPLPNGYVALYDKATPYQLTIALIDFNDDYSSDTNSSSTDQTIDDSNTKSESSASESELDASVDESIPTGRYLAKILSHNKVLHQDIKTAEDDNRINEFFKIIYDKIQRNDYTKIKDEQIIKASLDEFCVICNVTPGNITSLFEFLTTLEYNSAEILSNGFVVFYEHDTPYQITVAIMDLRNNRLLSDKIN